MKIFQKTAENNDETYDFYASALGSLEDVWSNIFARHNKDFKAPKLVLFEGNMGNPSASRLERNGPFYLPDSKTIYIPPSFNRILKKPLENISQVNFDFIRACTLAHEFGHHIQNITKRLPSSLPHLVLSDHFIKAGAIESPLKVITESNADYLAGVWAHHAHTDYNMLEKGDINAAIKLFHYIGDDNQQKQTQRPVETKYFMHGSSKQRVESFMLGFKEGSKHLRL